MFWGYCCDIKIEFPSERGSEFSVMLCIDCMLHVTYWLSTTCSKYAGINETVLISVPFYVRATKQCVRIQQKQAVSSSALYKNKAPF